MYLTGSETISIHAERLQISDAPRKQIESVFVQLLVRFNTKFKEKGIFKLLLGDKLGNILAKSFKLWRSVQ